MRICLYLEFYHFLNGFLYKEIGTGLLSSYKNQIKSLQSLDIAFTEKWDDSCDILQINTPWLRSLWLIKKAKRQGKKIIIWSHVTVEDFIQVFRFNKFIAPLMKKYLIYAYGLADLVFCPSAYTKSLLTAYGLPTAKLVVQSNGVDTSFIFPDLTGRNAYRQKYNLNQLTIGTVGLVIPRKGTATFLTLAKQCPQYQFIWFGKIYNALLAKPLPKNLPKNVTFTGYVQDVNAAFNAIDIFIFPSFEENQGMVLLEAAAIGLPILVRDIPAYNPWLKDGLNCLKAKKEEEFKTCLEQIINDEALRQQLGEGAKSLAQQEDIRALNQKLLERYQKLLTK
ncbi:glycosyltransferase family 4 protein [Patescibacteria group bacterium]|nr:glycosyltransferase family 4 protein [Patescibacteria group bacterium]